MRHHSSRSRLINQLKCLLPIWWDPLLWAEDHSAILDTCMYSADILVTRVQQAQVQAVANFSEMDKKFTRFFSLQQYIFQYR